MTFLLWHNPVKIKILKKKQINSNKADYVTLCPRIKCKQFEMANTSEKGKKVGKRERAG